QGPLHSISRYRRLVGIARGHHRALTFAQVLSRQRSVTVLVHLAEHLLGTGGVLLLGQFAVVVGVHRGDLLSRRHLLGHRLARSGRVIGLLVAHPLLSRAFGASRGLLVRVAFALHGMSRVHFLF